MDLDSILSRAPSRHLGPRKTPSFADTHDPGFDQRWSWHPKPQATTISAWEAKTPCRRGDLTGLTVLDAGCGIGRFMEVALAYGAEHVVGVDAAPHALEAAEKLLPKSRSSFIHADLLDLPIKSQSFDCAYSIGVLHHTRDPHAAFLAVADKVKVGGGLAVWLYEQPIAAPWLPAMEMFHDITKACPGEELHRICTKHAAKVRDAYAGAWEPISQLMRVSTSADDEECISDTFDWHAPQFRSWHTTSEVMRWFDKAGYEVLVLPDFPVSVCGRRLR